jgi:dTMP kinase
LVAEYLQTKGQAVCLTREPGGCRIADQVRAILLDADNSAMVPQAELLLYAAARAQHVAEIIRPALAAGQIVLCDRFTDATVAYQGYARGLEQGLIRHLNVLATGDLAPDLTILVDCPVSVGLGRAKARIAQTSGPREERFEREALAFHEKVRNGYLCLADNEPGRFRTVDGSAPLDDVTADIMAHITSFLANRAH